MAKDYSIVPFDKSNHRAQVIELWRSVFGYDTAHNEPSLAIKKKEEVSDGLFFVAESQSVIGTIMCGYDGHRGWIYSLAVAESHRGERVGSDLVAHAEKALSQLGCVKINMQIAEGNERVESFYHKLGYSTEARISMGKILSENTSNTD